MATPRMATPRIPTVVVATDGNVGVATVACGNIVTAIIGVPPWPWQRGLRHSTVPPRRQHCDVPYMLFRSKEFGVSLHMLKLRGHALI